MPNPYENLRHEEYPDAQPCREFNILTISDCRVEVAKILTAEAEPGKWVAGYQFYWADGRQSYEAPSLQRGWFDSEREARLFILGMYKLYLHLFMPETAKAVRAYEKEYSQNTLF